ncbi:uncharacterized protein SCHCODRAFT_02492901 [Schizophyllum commune H4-8]|nr:uncharacterized protein SCHCODRAFT_02492901 [Schizophyllum commune H4-8]KAI5897020.1 hypothetical protein SCHCODRAFT_02492901 [Schizophyllum commune H4-8]
MHQGDGACYIDQDILALIVEKLFDCSPSSIPAVVSCNRMLYETARPYLARQICLRMDAEHLLETQHRIKDCLHDASLSWILSAVRSATIRADSQVSPFHINPTVGELSKPSAWEPVINLLPTLGNLVDFTFDCPVPMPPALIFALHHAHPGSRLHVLHWKRPSPDTLFGDPSELALAESPLLRTLEADAWAGMRGADYQWPAFERIVGRAPNLDSFRWNCRHIGGCVVYGWSAEEAHERQVQKDRFCVQPIRKAIKSVDCAGLTSHSIAAWASFIDWSRVEHLRGLHITNHGIDLLDASVFAALKSLELTLGIYIHDLEDDQVTGMRNIITDFLVALPPLESLSLTNLHDHRPLEAALLHHGPHLRTLHLHEVELPTRPRRTLTAEDVAVISAMCPQLSDFALDIDRTPTHTHEDDICARLAQLPALRKLTLHLDLGLKRFCGPSMFDAFDRLVAAGQAAERGETREVDGSLRAYVRLENYHAEEAWLFLKERKVGTPLEKLVICVGEQYRDLGAGHPANWVIQEQSLRQHFKVLPHERDDRPNEVMIDTGERN